MALLPVEDWVVTWVLDECVPVSRIGVCVSLVSCRVPDLKTAALSFSRKFLPVLVEVEFFTRGSQRDRMDADVPN